VILERLFRGVSLRIHCVTGNNLLESFKTVYTWLSMRGCNIELADPAALKVSRS